MDMSDCVRHVLSLIVRAITFQKKVVCVFSGFKSTKWTTRAVQKDLSLIGFLGFIPGIL